MLGPPYGSFSPGGSSVPHILLLSLSVLGTLPGSAKHRIEVEKGARRRHAEQRNDEDEYVD
jgi:hypothetical protein